MDFCFFFSLLVAYVLKIASFEFVFEFLMNENERMNDDRQKRKNGESNADKLEPGILTQIHMHKRSHQKPGAIANDAQRPTILDHVNYTVVMMSVCWGI